ncbi:porin [Candidatus Liberibacter sp.]|uniref:porin n=1 Tax=Candidatus Liberibacter sp. TaxID=34022 RepID=UPI0015F674A6|nr:porin [Candidatus Liberibacter sp.]MBA5723580.1 porin [Candidatus Liberibacter sp.]
MAIKGIYLRSVAVLAMVAFSGAAQTAAAAGRSPTRVKFGSIVETDNSVTSSLDGKLSSVTGLSAKLDLNAVTDTNFGPIDSVFKASGRGKISSSSSGQQTELKLFQLDEISVAFSGVKLGYYASWWQGKGVFANPDAAKLTSLSYESTNGLIKAGVSADVWEKNSSNKDLSMGAQGMFSGVLGEAAFTLIGGYDHSTKNFAIRGSASTKDIGPGVIELYAVLANGLNIYYDQAKYAAAIKYQLKLNDDIEFSPELQYLWDKGSFYRFKSSSNKQDVNVWKAGASLKYNISQNLSVKSLAEYSSDSAVKITAGLNFQGAFSDCGLFPCKSR